MARQTGIDSEEMCDYLMFLDSDDELYPDAVGRLYREAKINQADLVISNIHMEATMSRGRVFEFGDNTTWFHGKIYSKAFLRKYHIAFTEEMRTLFQYNEDCYFNLLCVWLAEKKFFLEETTYLWRDNKNSLTRSISAKEFYYKYNKDYFYAQACALLSVILSYPERFFSIAPTISSLYRAHQLEIVRKTENVNAFSEVLVSLFSEPNFKERFYTSKCIMYLVNEAKQGESVENDIIFYPESIANWAKRHGLPMEGRSMKYVIINGSGGVGKDLFCNHAKIVLRSMNKEFFNYSTVDYVKESAMKLGWNGIKDERGRKFLSDLKAAMTEYNDIPFKITCSFVKILLEVIRVVTM